MQKISILIPCYNEEGNLEKLTDKLQEVIQSDNVKAYSFEILYVNDGSIDNTLSVLKLLSEKYANVSFISFSRNFGHQNALKAGFDNINADAVITMDADLQHPPRLLPELIKYWEEGYEVVNTKREEGENQSFLKKKTSYFFYGVLNLLSYVQIEPGTADFRLMDKKVLIELKKWNEQSLFYRGIIPWLGFKHHTIEYYPDKRHSGNTKYTLKKMIGLALTGVTSFSIKPLRISILAGVFLSLISLIYIFYALYISLFTEKAVIGWASVIVSVLFIGGLQLLILGIIGEYLGKLYIENKNRPSYIISEKSLKDDKK
jgi:polyisoprenyl-phosphate glycosyltransferase